MNFSLKSIASAVVLAVAVSGAHAASINAGSTGNGELFLNVWDANGSYSFDLNNTIDGFQGDVAASGLIDKTYALSSFDTFLAGVASSSLLKFSVLATDISGARRILTTFSQTATPISTTSTRAAAASISGFASAINAVGTAGDSVAVGPASAAFAGKAAIGSRIGGSFNFDSNGTLGANNSYVNGIGFERLDAPATGGTLAAYNVFKDEGKDVRVWIDGTNLHISAVAAVPEPESYAMLLAGLGMIGFMARRRQNAA